MELSLPNSSSLRFPQNDFVPLQKCSRLGSFHTFSLNKKLASKAVSLWTPLIWRQPRLFRLKAQSATDSNDKHGGDDFIVEDVPHLTHFLPDLPVISETLENTIIALL